MEVLFIRHGEPNYEDVRNLGLVSYLGELTQNGLYQAHEVAGNHRLFDAQIVVSSPFTRALQTAHIISQKNGIPLIVEPALHEWLADKTHQQTLDPDYGKNSYHEFLEHNGIRDENCKYNWESVDEIVARAYPVLEFYRKCGYKRIIVVAHAMLIRTFGYKEQRFPYCGIYEMEFNEDSKYEGFVPWNG